MSTKVNTPEFRVAFPNVFTPRKNDLNGKDEYSIVALFPKDADLSGLKTAAFEAAKKKWGDDQAKWPKLRSPFRDQVEKSKDVGGKQVLPEGYEAGAMFLTLRSTNRPGVVNQRVEDIIDTSDFYGGCYARAALNAFAYDAKGNRGISFGLNNIQKLRDGDPFGNRTKPQDDFEAVAVANDTPDVDMAAVGSAGAQPASNFFS